MRRNKLDYLIQKMFCLCSILCMGMFCLCCGFNLSAASQPDRLCARRPDSVFRPVSVKIFFAKPDRENHL